jgi:hypothetical protein
MNAAATMPSPKIAVSASVPNGSMCPRRRMTAGTQSARVPKMMTHMEPDERLLTNVSPSVGA